MPRTLDKSLRLIIISTILAFPFVLQCANAQSETSPRSIHFNYAFVALTYAGDRSQVVPLKSNHQLKSGDKLKLYLEALNESYFYLFHLGPDGILQQIFPQKHQAAKLPSDSKKIIPEGDNWLELDSQTGLEKFYLIASEGRQERLEELCAHHLTLKDNSDIQTSIKQILDEIKTIRRKNLSGNTERPVRIGGSFRSPGSEASQVNREYFNLASKVDTNGTYSRVFAIDHR